MRWLPPWPTLKPAPISTSSLASVAISGSRPSARATVVNGPPTYSVTSFGYLRICWIMNSAPCRSIGFSVVTPVGGVGTSSGGW